MDHFLIFTSKINLKNVILLIDLKFKTLIKDLAKYQLNVSIVQIHLKNWR